METPDLTKQTSAELFAAILAERARRGQPKPEGSVTIAEYAAHRGICREHATEELAQAARHGLAERIRWNDNGQGKYVYRLKNGTTDSAGSSRPS